jgi:hypothetical protein
MENAVYDERSLSFSGSVMIIRLFFSTTRPLCFKKAKDLESVSGIPLQEFNEPYPFAPLTLFYTLNTIVDSRWQR